jgi:hypothetical protein
MDYPEVPVGCRYFNPRRLRRHARKQRDASLRLQALAKLHELTAQRKSDRKAQLDAEVESKKTFGRKLVERVKGFTGRLFRRGVR